MTKHDLKELAAMGAELGAAKAEVERLRALLREAAKFIDTGDMRDLNMIEVHAALSQQAEPCDLGEGGISSSWKRAVIEAQAEPTDTYTAVDMATAAAQGFRDGQAAMEQAAAQDEKAAFDDWYPLGCPGAGVTAHLSARAGFRAGAAWQRTRPAQTEQQPEQSGLVAALEYYASGDHLLLADPDEWDTCSGEPANFLHDEAGTASVEDGSIAKVALEAYRDALSQQAEPECRCSMRERLVGDGCSICNPELAAELEDDEPAPAQDGREAFEAEWVVKGGVRPGNYSAELDRYVSERVQGRYEGWKLARITRPAQTAPQGKFRMGDLVKKSTGSEWEGRVVGWYSTEQTAEGYAVESSAHRNSVQIYPAKALEAVE